MVQHILIIDDDELTRRLSTYWLTRAGYACSEIDDIGDAPHIVRHQQPDLILMDCYLGHLNGVEMTREFKQDPQLATIPILGMTSDPYMRKHFMNAGATAYLTKPFCQHEFINTVMSLLP